MQTPNIDKLAKEGTLFDHAFTSSASCSVSRSIIYTGLHAHESGQFGLSGYGWNRCHYFQTWDHIESAPKLLNKYGYLTGIVGKIHVGPVPVYPWEVREESTARDVAWSADKAEAIFNRAKEEDRPFFVTVGYIDPHRDSTRGGFGNDEEYRNVHDKTYDPAKVPVPSFISDLPEVRQELSEYYRAVNRLDQGIGMVLDKLERSGMADDTLVMFVSDNGPPFINSKTTLYDAGVRLPMIVRRPGGPSGILNPNLVCFTDILPTFLDWAGQGSVKGIRKGRSILPVLGETKLHQHWRRVFGSHTFHEVTSYYPTRFLRTERYKYHRNIQWKLDFPFAGDLYAAFSWEGLRNQEPVILGKRPLTSYINRQPEELYDMWEDPQEVKNLASDPAYVKLVAEFREATEKWQLETGDPWLFRDGQSVKVLKHHIENGLNLPDRFDFDAKNAGNKGKVYSKAW